MTPRDQRRAQLPPAAAPPPPAAPPRPPLPAMARGLLAAAALLGRAGGIRGREGAAQGLWGGFQAADPHHATLSGYRRGWRGRFSSQHGGSRVRQRLGAVASGLRQPLKRLAAPRRQTSPSPLAPSVSVPHRARKASLRGAAVVASWSGGHSGWRCRRACFWGWGLQPEWH